MIRSAFWRHCALALICLLFLVGCERERLSKPVEPKKTVQKEPASLIEDDGWLLAVSAKPDTLAKLTSNDDGWADFLQNKPLESLYKYDDVATPSRDGRIGCARSALELAETAKRLEILVKSLLVRTKEIQATRPNGSAMAGWRDFAAGKPVPKQFQESLGVFAREDAPFLIADAKERSIPSPATDAYRSRWQFLDKLRDQPEFLDRTKMAVKMLKSMRGADFNVADGESEFDFIDVRTLNVSRLFFARKALRCLSGVSPVADLYRIRGLRLSDQPQKAKALAREATAMKDIPLSVQILSLETSSASLAQSLYLEELKASTVLGEKVEIDEDRFSTPSPISWIRKGEALALVSGKQIELTRELDSVSLNRQIMKELKKRGVQDTGTAELLVSRYVEELTRQLADVHYLREDFPRAAQVRRRIGGGEAFSVGPKVSMSALAGSALDHWKIVEPRAAIRYLKDLGEVFPNAGRASDLLRDILSYRARQSGGKTAAGH